MHNSPNGPTTRPNPILTICPDGYQLMVVAARHSAHAFVTPMVYKALLKGRGLVPGWG